MPKQVMPFHAASWAPGRPEGEERRRAPIEDETRSLARFARAVPPPSPDVLSVHRSLDGGTMPLIRMYVTRLP